MSDYEDVLQTPDVLSELDQRDPRRYRMNMDWVWSSTHNRGLRKRATVRAMVNADEVETLHSEFAAWVKHLHGPSDDGTWVHGGWFCQRVHEGPAGLELVFGSGWQDVAKSLDYGIQWFSGAVLGAVPSAAVTWEELPLDEG